MAGQTLTELATAHRADLERSLAGDSTPTGAARAVRRFLDAMRADLESSGTAGDPSAPMPRDLAVLEGLRGSCELLTAVQLAPQPPSAAARPSEPERIRLWRSLRRLPDPPKDEVRPPPELAVRPALLLAAVDDAIDAAARASAQSESPGHDAAPQEMDWSSDGQLLDLLQNLLSARERGNTEELLLLVEKLESDLRLFQGIDVVRCDAETKWFFAIRPHRDPHTHGYLTRRVALVRGDTVLRRGEARGGPAAATLTVDPDTGTEESHG